MAMKPLFMPRRGWGWFFGGAPFGKGVLLRKPIISTWTPEELTNLAAWFRADDVNTSGTDVTQWNDKSGNALHLNTPSANNPQLNSSNSSFGSQATIDFTASNNNSIERTTGTFMANGYNIFVLLNSNAGLATRSVLETQTFLDGLLYVAQATFFPSVNSSSILATSTNVGSNVFLFDVWWNNTGTEVTVDGTIDATGDAGGDPSAAGLVVGAAGNNTLPLEGSIAEIIITSAHIDDTSDDYANLMTYFNNRYGTSLATVRS